MKNPASIPTELKIAVERPVARSVLPSADSANLDYLRSIAVLCVLWDHVWGYIWPSSSWVRLHDTLGRIGVLIFFVHTSLVLMLSLERSYAVGKRPALDFYLRRAFRIYPLVIVCTLSAVLLNIPPWPTMPLPHLSSYTWISNLLLIQNVTHQPSVLIAAWSLPYEIQMYLLLPWLFLAVKRSGRPWLTVMQYLLIAIIAQRAFTYAGVVDLADLLQFVPCFMAGILAFTLRPRHRISSFGWLAGLPLTIAAACFLFGSAMPKSGQWALCLVLGSAIPFFSETPFRWLSKACHLIAKYSYGIYLSHVPALVLAVRLDVPWQRYTLMAGLLVMLPVCLYHLIEDPMIRYGKSLCQ